jgi:heparanase 1
MIKVEITVELPGTLDRPCRVLHPHFLSFTIDISVILGGHWWGQSKEIVQGVASDRAEKLNLKDRRLRAYARLLAPAMIRIGGTEADRVKYKPGKKAVAELYPQALIPGDNVLEDPQNHKDDYEYTLTKGLWKRLHGFIKKTGMELLFTISAGLSDRDKDGVWQETNARKLIAYSVKKKHPVAAWEFGNEINGFPFIYGWSKRITPRQYERDLARFGHLVKSLSPGSLIVGPASAVWPVIGEPYPIIKGLCKSPSAIFLDAVSWHYYPLQSSRGKIAIKRVSGQRLLSPRALDEISRWNKRVNASLKRVNKIRPESAPSENWLTETGHALYGGEPGVSDTFISTLWWLDELGLLAREGTARVFRQSLIGANYGLLDEQTLEPRPDFYASFLWKRLMGNSVYTPHSTPPEYSKVRFYLHTEEGGIVTLLAINLDKKRDADLVLKAPVNTVPRVKERYLLQGNRGPASKTMLLNGVPIENDLAFQWGKKKTVRKYGIRPSTELEPSLRFTLPPLSILFLRCSSGTPPAQGSTERSVI